MCFCMFEYTPVCVFIFRECLFFFVCIVCKFACVLKGLCLCA